MKTILLLLLILLCCPIISCTVPTRLVQIENASSDNLKASVNNIVNDSASRNYWNIEELNRVAGYIKSEIEGNGLSCIYQEYDTETGRYKNVVCSMDMLSEETIVVGAHYDVFESVPGADDNASGVAAIIELSRILNKYKRELKYNIEIVAFTLEEPPYFRTSGMGSLVYVKSLLEKKRSVKASIIFDMIGYYTDKKIQKYSSILMKPFYPDHGNFIAALSNMNSSHFGSVFCKTMEKISKLECQPLIEPSWVLADHQNFWESGYDAILITDTASNRNKNYHTMSDRKETLDYQKMGYVVDGVAQTILGGNI